MPTSIVSFADVAHQQLTFDRADPTGALILDLIDTRWVQRLRHVRQTGNTHLLYMFSEHSRFGHSLGVAYLAMLLMRNLNRWAPKMVDRYGMAVAAAALLHDVGHVAPGSHLAARIWTRAGLDEHEHVSCRVVTEDKEIRTILERANPELPELISRILSEDESLPPWTTRVISGSGWNADRGNWTIVDSAMCSVSYGRYNVMALIDAFRLTEAGDLLVHESRLDALTHFYMARDSMYRQVYQHRVLQAADMLTQNIVVRVRDLAQKHASNDREPAAVASSLNARGIFIDQTMSEVLASANYARELPLATIFQMTESWWTYHLDRWCTCEDDVLRDLSERLRHRRLFKTIRLDGEAGTSANRDFLDVVKQTAQELGFDPAYYVAHVANSDRHRGKSEDHPLVLLDSGAFKSVVEVEPMIRALVERPEKARSWVAVPKEVKEKVGRRR